MAVGRDILRQQAVTDVWDKLNSTGTPHAGFMRHLLIA
jgi:hypothetical protein